MNFITHGQERVEGGRQSGVGEFIAVQQNQPVDGLSGIKGCFSRSQSLSGTTLLKLCKCTPQILFQSLFHLLCKGHVFIE